MRGTVLVTPRSMTAAGVDTLETLAPLRAAGYRLASTAAGVLPSLEHLRTAPASVVGWIAGVERIGEAELDLFPRLVGISRNGAGADAIDLAAAAARGIEVATARGANARGVAELTLAHILNALRRLSWADRDLRVGGWSRSIGRELPEETVGVVGLGAVGGLVAGFALALGARVVAHDPFAPADASSQVERATLEEVFRASSVVSLHSPPAADGVALVGRAQLELLRPGAILVNTARSSLVDPEAVLSALETGRLASYSVDAFDEEPPTLTPLLAHDNTVLTPHLGGFTAQSVRRATEQSVDNLLSILNSRG